MEEEHKELGLTIRPYGTIKDRSVRNYDIIGDYSQLEEFIAWLPDLERNETYYMTLLARNKYCSELTHIKSDREQLKRITTTKERMINKLKQMECPLGTYKQKETEIPQEALALYIHPNPRNVEIGAKTALKSLLDKVTGPYDGYNPHQIVLSGIQGARGRKIFSHFDFDHVILSHTFIDYVLGTMINLDACSVIKTRGGFHLLIRNEKIEDKYSKTWYSNVIEIEPDHDTPVGDMLMPIPGCMQGDFVPFFYLKDGIKQ